MKSEIYTATAMSNDADVALQEAVQKLWRTAATEYRESVRHQFSDACSHSGNQRGGGRADARPEAMGATARKHSTEQILITAIMIVEVLAG